MGRAREDYVKAIFQLGGSGPVSAADLARYLSVSRAAITKFRRVLERDGLVKPATARVDHIDLTAKGHSLAVGMVRRHRLVETFLHQALGMTLESVHAQAEAIEHVISNEVADRLERFLGNPQTDPHGHPITSVAMKRGRRSALVLAKAPAGTRIRVEGIPDRDASVTKRLIAQRVLPGLIARVVERGERTVKLRSTHGLHTVSLAAAQAIQISALHRRSRN